MRNLSVLAILLAACRGSDPVRLSPADVPARVTKIQDPSELPVRKELPDPLVMLDGRKVATEEQWSNERRPELKALFQQYMYGFLPPRPDNVKGTEQRVDANAFGGKATLKEVAITFGPTGTPPINLLLVVPNKRNGPAPAFLGLNFTGNHSVVADPNVAIPKGWMRPARGSKENRATEEGRGKAVDNWSIEQSIDRGYAVATFYYGDGLPDKHDFKDGIYPHIVKPEPAPTDCGAVAFWAWTLHRAVDYLLTNKDVDGAKIAVMGHSRNGKAALVAGAFDDRIALVIPHQAGCGGTAPSRTKNPKAETVKIINKAFPHWFSDIFPKFDDQVERLPFDQNCLAALVAPRPLLYTNAQEDQWADPGGQFELLQSASSVYRLLGREGLGASEPPPLGKLVDSTVGYFIRAGKHSTTPEDWKVFLDFADKHFRK